MSKSQAAEIDIEIRKTVKGNKVNMSTSGQPAKWASPNTAVAAWTAPSTEKTSFNLLLHYIQILIYLDWIFFNFLFI